MTTLDPWIQVNEAGGDLERPLPLDAGERGTVLRSVK